MPTHPIVAEDIQGVLARTQSLWPDLKGASVFITGATGFFGIWLLETLLAANREFSLGLRVLALSRNPSSFSTKAAHLANDSAMTWVTGDVRDFPFPAGPITHVIHAATESSTTLNTANPQEMFDVCVEGTRRVLSLAKEKNVSRMLFTSSGAVYGRQPPELSRVPEDYFGGPDPLDCSSAYAEGKRAAEFLCGLAATDSTSAVSVSIARCFAFVGPYLRLDAHFAIGNFIRDALTGGPIRIAGDGTPMRSYLYAADLADWLITILLRGRSGRAYNVGSEDGLPIVHLAARVAHVAARLLDIAQPAVAIARPTQACPRVERYVPSCFRARVELSLSQQTQLNTAITRTLQAIVTPSDNAPVHSQAR